MSDSEINVVSRTQIVRVEPTSKSVSMINAGPQGPAGPGSPVQIATFVEYVPGGVIYDIPEGCTMLHMICIGAGGGGGSGRRGAAGTGRSGGAGGGGGGYSAITVPASIVTPSVHVYVGEGGSGATGRTTDNTDGTSGGQGDNSHVRYYIPDPEEHGSYYCIAGGGESGQGGDLDQPADYSPGGEGLNWGTAGGGSPGLITDFGGASDGRGIGTYRARHMIVQDFGSSIFEHTPSYAPTYYGGVGGGGGGAILNDDVWRYGGDSNGQPFTQGGGVDFLTEGADGEDGNLPGYEIEGRAFGAGGGGGGNAGHTVAAGNGGHGGYPGGGGGGGGASTNGFNSGSAGNGADGMVVIFSW